jgi:hypothetical protein
MENNLSDEKVWASLGVLKASALQRDYFSLPKREGDFQTKRAGQCCGTMPCCLRSDSGFEKNAVPAPSLRF